jgi:23S rRNA U2552 (ribose-2'-O)-methylase RlmE/FtsJ
MSFFLLPHINNTINNDNIELKYNNDNISYISLTLNNYLNNIKLEINNNYETWDFVKKYTNPYEFIHTNVPNSKCSISKYNPLSRSFYKMIELSNMLNIFDDFKDININTFHLAEGPGGFIEATNYLRKNKSDKYYGMTLIEPTNNNVPGWNKSSSYLEANSNIIIEKGISGTGDLLLVDNLKHCNSLYANSMNIITADGGFDFSIDFNKQELLATNLLFAQVSFAISMQKINGHFILKIFDIFTKTTIDIIYLLSSLYKEVYIVKPNTSRMANSEKYVVCKYFKKSQPELINKIISEYHNLQDNPYISSIFNFNIDYYYINKLEEINAIFGQQQIENILLTINLINSKNKHKNDKNDKFKIHNVQKCIQWCEKHNIPYNKTINTNNIFLNN